MGPLSTEKFANDQILDNHGIEIFTEQYFQLPAVVVVTLNILYEACPPASLATTSVGILVQLQFLHRLIVDIFIEVKYNASMVALVDKEISHPHLYQASHKWEALAK